MAGHAQFKFVMTECSKTQIRLTGLKCFTLALNCSSNNDQIEFGFWIWRYVMTAALLVICIVNLGLPTAAAKTLKDEDKEKV